VASQTDPVLNVEQVLFPPVDGGQEDVDRLFFEGEDMLMVEDEPLGLA
jgi:hypothetical protein